MFYRFMPEELSLVAFCGEVASLWGSGLLLGSIPVIAATPN